MARRTDYEEETITSDDVGEFSMDDFFDQEIDQGELTELQMEAEAEEAARKVPEGHYVTVTPYPVKRESPELEVINAEGETVTIKRGQYNYFGDAIHEQTEAKFKLGLRMSPKKLYVVWNGPGNPPTYYTTKVDGSQLDPASQNYSKAAKLYREATGQDATQYAELEAFVNETQLRLTVKKFKSGKSGVVGFELPKD
jgi:hypothetical protein